MYGLQFEHMVAPPWTPANPLPSQTPADEEVTPLTELFTQICRKHLHFGARWADFDVSPLPARGSRSPRWLRH